MFFFGKTNGFVQQTCQSQGVKRSYWMQPPVENASLPQKRALVVLLHGANSNGFYFDQLTVGKFRELAQRDGALLVFPDAYQGLWNDGRNTADIPAYRAGVDDSAFLSGLISDLVNRYEIDPERVFIGGVSNGGMMAARFACEYSDHIAALGMVIANLPENISHACRPVSPFSVIIINGADDPIVPYNGGEVTWFGERWGKVLSTENTARFWKSALFESQLDALIEQSALPDNGDGTRVLKSIYASAPNRDIVVYTIQGGGHTWPGGLQYIPQEYIGRTSRQINASTVLWEFFMSHGKS